MNPSAFIQQAKMFEAGWRPTPFGYWLPVWTAAQWEAESALWMERVQRERMEASAELSRQRVE